MNTHMIEKRMKYPYNLLCVERERKRKELHEQSDTKSKISPSHLVAEQMCSEKENQSHLTSVIKSISISRSFSFSSITINSHSSIRYYFLFSNNDSTVNCNQIQNTIITFFIYLWYPPADADTSC
jgi:hypothetical protein